MFLHLTSTVVWTIYFSGSSIVHSFRNFSSKRRPFVGMNYFRPCCFGFHSYHIYEARLFFGSNSCHVSCPDWLFVHRKFAIFPHPNSSSAPFKLLSLSLSVKARLDLKSHYKDRPKRILECVDKAKDYDNLISPNSLSLHFFGPEPSGGVLQRLEGVFRARGVT